MRQYTALDRFLMQADRGLRTVLGSASGTARPSPAAALPEPPLSDAERDLAGRLMRINHAGEVAAQALYHGQALTAKLPQVRAQMDTAAREENDHLTWCEQRVHELGGRTSVFSPLWYLGSLAIGAFAGAVGDRWSLGFLAETEHQVVAHLDGHLHRLPPADDKSRAIVSQMQEDEGRHARVALRAGGVPLPGPVRGLMRLTAGVMTGTAYWL